MKFVNTDQMFNAFFKPITREQALTKAEALEYKNMQKWIVRFCEEKQIDLGDWTTNGNGEAIQFGHVMSEVMSAPYDELKAIIKKMIWLDFKNQPIEPYIEHLAKALK